MDDNTQADIERSEKLWTRTRDARTRLEHLHEDAFEVDKELAGAIKAVLRVFQADSFEQAEAHSQRLMLDEREDRVHAVNNDVTPVNSFPDRKEDEKEDE